MTKGACIVVSYDGRTGEKTYGEPLPRSLNLVHIEVHAGRSTQATLLGRDHDTYESLYLSPALAEAISFGKKRRAANGICVVRGLAKGKGLPIVPQDLPEWFIKKAKTVTAKRAKTVIDHILKHGHITTEELKNLYGYDHPPRAARDVREQGIPLETFRIAGSQEASRLSFCRSVQDSAGTLSGRKVFQGIQECTRSTFGCKCGVCLTNTKPATCRLTIGCRMRSAGRAGAKAHPTNSS